MTPPAPNDTSPQPKLFDFLDDEEISTWEKSIGVIIQGTILITVGVPLVLGMLFLMAFPLGFIVIVWNAIIQTIKGLLS